MFVCFLGAFGKFLKAAAGVNMLGLPGIERMTVAADFNANLGYGSPARPRVPAGAPHNGMRKILGVDPFFHGIAMVAYFC